MATHIADPVRVNVLARAIVAWANCGGYSAVAAGGSRGIAPLSFVRSLTGIPAVQFVDGENYPVPPKVFSPVLVAVFSAVPTSKARYLRPATLYHTLEMVNPLEQYLIADLVEAHYRRITNGPD